MEVVLTPAGEKPEYLRLDTRDEILQGNETLFDKLRPVPTPGVSAAGCLPRKEALTKRCCTPPPFLLPRRLSQ